MRLNNISLKNKIILIFIICVLVPLVSTNGFIIWSMKQQMENEQEKRIENISDRIENEIARNIENVTAIMDNLYMDEKLDAFLNKKYYNEVDYYSAYRALMEDNLIHYYYTAQSVNGITICTENDSITNGTYFIKRKDIENSSWYQAFKESGQQIYLYTYFEDGLNSSGYMERIRHIALLRKLDYFGGKDIIMMDLDYDEIMKDIAEQCEGSDGYILDRDKIIFSTKEQNGIKKQFEDLSNYHETGQIYANEISSYGADWKIAVMAPKIQFGELIVRNKGPFLLIYLLNMILPTFIVVLVYKSLIKRISITEDYLRKVEKGEYEEMTGDYGRDEIGHLIHSYNMMVAKIKELIEDVFKNKERQQSLEISKKQAELNALQSQINPHFMFNALESIRMHSVLKKEEETAKILESFAILMRKNIQWNTDFVTVQEECENITRYLQIQKYRFGDRLTFSVHVEEESAMREIPKFIIMTFVENACVHGIEQSVGGGSITVMVSEDDNSLYFEIMDSGNGMTEEELERLIKRVDEADIQDIKEARASIGILNTVVRMKQYYNENVAIDINSTPGEGTEICVAIPKTVSGKEKND